MTARDRLCPNAHNYFTSYVQDHKKYNVVMISLPNNLSEKIRRGGNVNTLGAIFYGPVYDRKKQSAAMILFAIN